MERSNLAPRTRLSGLALGAVVAVGLGCYQGGEREKEPPPGYPGGFCLQAATCYQPGWVCEPEGLYCYNIQDPCEGIFCGGHGECAIDSMTALPICLCDPGYSNAMYSLYCLAGY